MATPASTHIAAWLLDQLPQTITTYVNAKEATMISIIAPVGGTLLIIYVLLWGMGIATGQIAEPFTDGAKRIIRMSLIVTFALTLGVYQGQVSNLFLNAPSQMAAELIRGPGTGSTAATMATPLDDTMNQGLDVGSSVWEYGEANASMHNGEGIGYYVMAILIDASVAIVVAIACGIIFVAFVALAILLAIGPLFILMAIFKQTQRFFEAWIGQVLNFALLFILVAVAMGLVVALFDSFLTALPSSASNQVIINVFKIFGASLAVVAVLFQTRTIASSLGGGISLMGQNLAGRLARGTMGVGRAGLTGSAHTHIGSRGSGAEAARQYKAIGGTLALPATKTYVLARRVWQGSHSASKG